MMRYANPLLAVAALAVVATGVLQGPLKAQQAAAPAANGQVAEGKKLFVGLGCYQCHGYAGQGSPGTGPALVPLRFNDAGFTAYVRNPKGVMPAFSAKLLSDAQIVPMLAYIHSLPPGRPIKDIPLLAGYAYTPVGNKAAPMKVASTTSSHAAVPAGNPEGAKLYGANCAACHGGDLSGGVGPDLRTEGSKRSADDIAALIASPPVGMPKLTPAPLSATQVKQIAVFIAAGR